LGTWFSDKNPDTRDLGDVDVHSAAVMSAS